MSQPALVGEITPDGMYTARYLHWSGSPGQLVPVIAAIWAGFGGDSAATITALLQHDWSSLCVDCPCKSMPPALARPGVGHASPGGDGPLSRGQAPTAIREGYLEWMYLIDAAAAQVVVYEATVHSRWLPHSRHPLAADLDSGEVLGCGGYRTDGHAWVPARLTLPATDTVYPGQICTAAHPSGQPVARLTWQIADRIAADTQDADANHEGSTPLAHLRRAGDGFDLIWSTGHGYTTRTRLPRDGDGSLLLDRASLTWQPADEPRRP